MTKPAVETFAADHEVEVLRGEHKVRASSVRRALRKRVEFLASKVEERKEENARLRSPWRTDPLFDELRALVQVLEMLPEVSPEKGAVNSPFPG